MKILSYAHLCILPKQSLRLQEMAFPVSQFSKFSGGSAPGLALIWCHRKSDTVRFFTKSAPAHYVLLWSNLQNLE